MNAKRSQSGQALVLCGFVLAACIAVLLRQFSVAFLGNQKIKNQSAADSAIVLMTAPQAQSLNAIAAYNQGIDSMTKQAVAFTVVLLGALACAYWAPPCAYTAKNGMQIAPGFYKKIQKFLDHAKKSQDQLRDFANQAPASILLQLNVFNAFYPTFKLLSPQPLPLVRAHPKSSSKEDEFTQGGDWVECKNKTYKIKDASHFSFIQTKIKPNMSQHDSVDITYQSAQKLSLIKVFTAKDVHAAHFQYIKQHQFYHAKQMLWHKCESYQNLLQKLGNLTPLRIPPPYVLKPSFIQGQNIRSLESTLRSKSQLPDYNTYIRESDIPNLNFKAHASSKITGENLREMEFDVELTKTPPLKNNLFGGTFETNQTP